MTSHAPPSCEDAPGSNEAHNRIMALLEADSDDEDTSNLAPASPCEIAGIFSSSPVEASLPQKTMHHDIDLDDEPPVRAYLPMATEEEVAEEGEDDGSAAYARMLSALSKPKPRSPAGTAGRLDNTEKTVGSVSSDESDEDMPVKKVNVRRRRVSTQRSSPSSSQRSSPRQAMRSPSCGLFVSPEKGSGSARGDRADRFEASESEELPEDPINPRLEQLIAQKKAERLAKEKEQRRKEKLQRQKLAKQFSDVYSSELNDGMTKEVQETLTKTSRPTQRKASKKAIEEMNRETQRMARNQQLTHQVRVKTRHSTKDFVAKFLGISVDASSGNEDERHHAMASSDRDDDVAKATPPSSPPSVSGTQRKHNTETGSTEDDDQYIIRTGEEQNEEELPNIEQILSDPVRRLNKGKGRADEAPNPRRDLSSYAEPRKQIRAVLPGHVIEDADDELEILPAKASRFAVFDKLPEPNTREQKSMLNLRALAHMHVSAENTRKGKPTVSQAEVSQRLREEMQKQALAAKRERIAFLKAKGIVLRTDDEIEEDQMHIENMLEKARQEVMELGRKEKEAADRNGEEIDANYELPSSDESVGDSGEEEEDELEAELELSGSEDEDGGEGQEDSARMELTRGLLDDAAEEANQDSEEDGLEEHGDAEQDCDSAPPSEDEAMLTAAAKSRIKHRARNVIVDEDDEEERLPQTPSAAGAAAKPRINHRSRNVIVDDDDQEERFPLTPSAAASAQSKSLPFVPFGFRPPQTDISLTQMFRGTMEDLAQGSLTQAAPSGDALDFLRDVPVCMMPAFSPANPVSNLLVPSSQPLATPLRFQDSAAITPGFSPQFPTPAAVTSQHSPSKNSEIPEPTQDVGFEKYRAAGGAVPTSTVETVMVPVQQSPVQTLRKGKLRRRMQEERGSTREGAAIFEVEEESLGDDEEEELNGFEALMKAQKAMKARPAIPEFNKKDSKAKGMVEEQAEESEDEYAGLGGNSDDESDQEMDEEVQAMLDEGPVDVNEREIARFYAERDLAENEKNLEKLHRDLTTGALRRKRGVGGLDDLSDDSDDEAERKRQKTLAFQRQYRALVEDENIKKTAENPKRAAFFKTLQDNEDENDFDHYLGTEVMDTTEDSQSQQETSQAAEDGQSIPGPYQANVNEPRPVFANATGKENVDPNMSHRRRPAEESFTGKRPVNLKETRESISFLIEEAHLQVPDSQLSDASDDDLEISDSAAGLPLPHMRSRRSDGDNSVVLTSVRASVVNRLALSRQNSAADDEAQSGPMAFHASASNGAFKVPSLLRRATTNQSNSSSSTMESRRNSQASENGAAAVRMGGSKKSNIHFQAREAERMKKVRDADRRRMEDVRGRVKAGRSVLGTSLGAKGSGFE